MRPMLYTFLSSTGIILGWAFAGALFAYLGRSFLPRYKKLLSLLSFIVLSLLVWTMGFRLGTDPELEKNLGRLGLLALGFAFLSVLFSFAASFIYGKLQDLIKKTSTGFGSEQSQDAGKKAPVASPKFRERLSYFKDPLVLIFLLVLGIVSGQVFEASLVPESFSSWVLYGLIFFSGISMVLEGGEGFKALLSPDTLLLPLVTALGSLLAGLVAALLGGLSLHEGLCASAGFGWYSLSGILITDLGNPFLGNVSFLSNLFRESLALIFIPSLGRLGFKKEAISIAGATSMDVTLPLLGRYAGPSYLALSMAHGILLSLLVPLLVPFFYSLGL